MRSATPKVLHEILGAGVMKPAIAVVLKSEPDRMLVVVPPGTRRSASSSRPE